MSKPKETNCALFDTGKGELHVWCVAFKIKGSIPRNEKGLVDEAARVRKQKQIAKLIEQLEIPED